MPAPPRNDNMFDFRCQKVTQLFPRSSIPTAPDVASIAKEMSFPRSASSSKNVTVTLSDADSGAAGERRSALENGLGIKADVEVEHAADGG